ncbi:MAG: hypothetical protein JW909_13340 [Planctomycetes bacterium]|nr:hypothetical protein [Planctomycetota bacterium]
MLENEVDVDSSTCVDRIRYRLVEENGRYVFRNIEIIGDDACNGGFLEKLKEMTEGHSMDEIDLDDLERHQCARGAARSCYQAMGKILRDLREILP